VRGGYFVWEKRLPPTIPETTVPSGWIVVVVSPVPIATSEYIPRHAMIVLQAGKFTANVIFDGGVILPMIGAVPQAGLLLANIPVREPFVTEWMASRPLCEVQTDGTGRTIRTGRD